jgi:hypothetical protein
MSTIACQSIDTIDPIKIVPGGRLQLLVASRNAHITRTLAAVSLAAIRSGRTPGC